MGINNFVIFLINIICVNVINQTYYRFPLKRFFYYNIIYRCRINKAENLCMVQYLFNNMIFRGKLYKCN